MTIIISSSHIITVNSLTISNTKNLENEIRKYNYLIASFILTDMVAARCIINVWWKTINSEENHNGIFTVAFCLCNLVCSCFQPFLSVNRCDTDNKKATVSEKRKHYGQIAKTRFVWWNLLDLHAGAYLTWE